MGEAEKSPRFENNEDFRKSVEDMVNKALAAAGEDEETRGYKYYGWHNQLFRKRGNRIFCYTPYRIDGKFLSWEYVCVGHSKAKMRNKASHARRKDANARALRLFESYYEWTSQGYRRRKAK